jgi:hypothetical protein
VLRDSAEELFDAWVLLLAALARSGVIRGFRFEAVEVGWPDPFLLHSLTARVHAALLEKLAAGNLYTDFDLPQVYEREALRAHEFNASLADWETQWIKTPKSYWRKLETGSDVELLAHTDCSPSGG